MDGRLSASIPFFCLSPIEPLVYPPVYLGAWPFLLIYLCSLLIKIIIIITRTFPNLPLQILVGESLVKQEDPRSGITGLFGKDIYV